MRYVRVEIRAGLHTSNVPSIEYSIGSIVDQEHNCAGTMVRLASIRSCNMAISRMQYVKKRYANGTARSELYFGWGIQGYRFLHTSVVAVASIRSGLQTRSLSKCL